MKASVVAALVAAAAAAAALLAATGAAGTQACPATNSPNELVVASGSDQEAQLEKPFGEPLQVQLANTNGCALTGNLAGISIHFDAPGSGASGVFASTGTNETTVGTDSSGVATAPTFTANDTAGAYTVDVSSDYGTVELFLSNTASGVLGAIGAVGTTTQQAIVGTQYGAPLQARVLDADGEPIQGVTVDFALETGPYGAGAQFVTGSAQAAATTNASGIATSPLFVANADPGSFVASASTDGLSTVAVYSLDNHTTITSLRALAPSPQTTVVGTHFAGRLNVLLLDLDGQPVEGAPVTFTLPAAATGAGAMFRGGSAQATAVTDAAGEASSPAVVANTTAGTFLATATFAADAVTFPLRVVAGPAHAIAAGAASGETAGVRTRYPVRLAVTVTDKDGNPVPGAVVTFAAPLRGPSGRFGRAGGSRVSRVATDSRGIAIAPPFFANRRPGGFVVTARVGEVSARAAFALTNLPRG